MVTWLSCIICKQINNEFSKNVHVLVKHVQSECSIFTCKSNCLLFEYIFLIWWLVNNHNNLYMSTSSNVDTYFSSNKVIMLSSDIEMFSD